MFIQLNSVMNSSTILHSNFASVTLDNNLDIASIEIEEISDTSEKGNIMLSNFPWNLRKIVLQEFAISYEIQVKIMVIMINLIFETLFLIS